MNILGYPYDVELVHDLEPMGRVRVSTLHIEISDKICGTQRASTMLHEVLEALNAHLELGLSHAAIMGLESGLFQVFDANGVDLTPLADELDKKN